MQCAASGPGVGVGYAGYGTPAVRQAAPVYAGASYAQPAGAGPTVISAAPQVGGAVGGANLAQMQKLMDNRKELKNAVVTSFKRVAGSNRNIDINGLRQMRIELSGMLGIPEHVFGTIEDEYIRFDFEGTGFLEANEVYKLVKWHLYEYLHEIGGSAKGNIPMRSPQQAGYTMTRELGAGNQALIKEAIDKYGNQRCIKCYKKGGMTMQSLNDIQEECETMQLLACKNIARTFEMFQDANFVYMVNEVYYGGDLTTIEQKAVAKMGAGGITEDWWRGIFRQCVEALQFMHQQAMMHCDIKEPNMMLRTDNYASPQVVLIDFGVSKAMTEKDTGMVSGTPGYMPPETMNVGKWYPGGDIFSMGVTIVQLLLRKVPDEDKAKQGIMIGIFLEGCRSIEDVKNAVNSRQAPIHQLPYPGLQQIVGRMLDKNMRTRVKAPVVLKDPWFGGGRAQQASAVEKAMMPQHPLATCGITDEMMAAPAYGMYR